MSGVKSLKPQYRNIERLRAAIEKSLTRTDSTLDYSRTVLALERLSNLLNETETNTDVWYLGEFGYSLDSIIVGAYWHLTEWHAGQWSDEYRAMCALGQIFDPGMACGPEPDSCEQMVYSDLEVMAQ